MTRRCSGLFTAVGFVRAVDAVVVTVTDVVAWDARTVRTRRFVDVTIARRRRTQRRTVLSHPTNTLTVLPFTGATTAQALPR